MTVFQTKTKTTKTQTRHGAGLRTVHPATTIVPLYGEIDIFTSPALRERLLRALRLSTGPLVLDLSRVSFCDVSGLAVLVGTQRRARALGITLRLAAPRSQTVRMLRVTGLDRVLMMHGSDQDEPETYSLPAQTRTGD
ncbi:STAS domain-containing protein [Streptosporangium roseum]|uniref:STAS domain-containing protein n=1 Tax=Streptosporangium roseum TaxID=2001 RepID=UPI0033166459